MTAKELADYIRLKTRTNSTTFTDADMLLLVKLRQDELSRKLMDSLSEDEDIFLIPQTTNLVVNQREYNFPSDILSRIKRVEATFDGITWVKLRPFDITEYSGTHNETEIVTNFTNDEDGAFYDVSRKALYIYSGSIIAVTNGLKLWCYTYPTNITNLTENTVELEADPDTTHPGFPRELQELLGRGVIIDYKESREKPIPLTEKELSYKADVTEAIKTLKHTDNNRSIIASIPRNDGSQY